MVRILVLAGMVSGALLVATGPARADGWAEQKLTADDGIAFDAFGTQVVVSGDTAVVSAPTPTPGAEPGKVYVFTQANGTWTQTQKLTGDPVLAPPPDWPDFFGWSVALSGDTLVVGAPQAFNPQFGPVGAAYVFTRSDGIWSQQQELVTTDTQPSQWFGTSVGLDGDVAVVGATGSDQVGAGYVFTRSGETWTEQQKLSPSDGVPGQGRQFAQSIAFDGATLLIGASGPAFTTGTPPVGAVYAFTGAGATWTEVQKLTASDGAQGDQFGFSIALVDDTALIGAAQATIGGNASQGAVYFFEHDGDVWAEARKIADPEGAQFDRFGYSVGFENDLAVVGKWRRNPEPGGSQPPPDTGSVALLARTEGVWDLEEKLVAADGEPGNIFGWNVSIDGPTVMVGATNGVAGNNSRGAAYSFLAVPEDHAVIEGTVFSAGHCGSGPQPLEEATVEIQGGNGVALVQTHQNGRFQVAVPAAQGSVDIVAKRGDHLQELVTDVTVEPGETVVQDFSLVLDGPCASTNPASVSMSVAAGDDATYTLVVDNSAGTVDLDWLAGTVNPPAGVGGNPAVTEQGLDDQPVFPEWGYPDLPPGEARVAGREAAVDYASLTGRMLPGMAPVRALDGGFDCDNQPGLIMHDDGIVDNGYGANPNLATQAVYVDRFTPVAYPAPVTGLCVAFLTGGPSSLDFEVVLYDDDGPGGGPGTELAAQPASTGNLGGSQGAPVWAAVDLSSLGVSIESGSIHIGVRWAPANPGVFIAVDESPPNPPGFAGGHWWTDATGQWQSLAQSFATYRSLFVRAITDPGGCHSPAEIDWLSISPDAGQASAGATGEIEITFATAALSPGTYEANLCIESNDPVRPLVVVPVSLVVVAGDLLFRDRFE